MSRDKEQRQFYIVLLLAVIVLAISVWAFIQGIQAPAQEGIVQRDMSGNEDMSNGVDGEKQEKKDEQDALDTEALVKAALSQISYETELVQMEAAVAESMITTADEDTKIELYMGEGTCSDELLIVTVPDSDSIKKEVKNVQKHLTDMQQSFQDYLPKEAKKIDDAVILQTKNYIVACVTLDKENARKVIEQQLQ